PTTPLRSMTAVPTHQLSVGSDLLTLPTLSGRSRSSEAGRCSDSRHAGNIRALRAPTVIAPDCETWPEASYIDRDRRGIPQIAAAARERGNSVMDRRTFIVTVAGILLAATRDKADAQQAHRMWRIGILVNSPITDPAVVRIFEAFFM